MAPKQAAPKQAAPKQASAKAKPKPNLSHKEKEAQKMAQMTQEEREAYEEKKRELHRKTMEGYKHENQRRKAEQDRLSGKTKADQKAKQEELKKAEAAKIAAETGKAKSRRENSQEDIRALWMVVRCCRCTTMTACLGLGIAIALVLQGRPYYVLTSTEGVLPHCRAIILDRDEIWDMSSNLVELDVGGQRLIDFPEAQAQISIERIRNAAGDSIQAETTMSASLADVQAIDSAECKLMAPTLGVIDSRKQVGLLDTSTGQEVEMTDPCGGDQPGWWLQGAPEGVWASPIIGSLVAWYVIRCLWLAASGYIDMHAGNRVQIKTQKIKGRRGDHEVDQEKRRTIEQALVKRRKEHEWTLRMWPVLSWLLNTLVCNVLLNPLQRLSGVDACSQLVTSFYSGTTQTFIAWMCAPLSVVTVGFTIKIMRKHGFDAFQSSLGATGHAAEESILLKAGILQSVGAIAPLFVGEKSQSQSAMMARVLEALGSAAVISIIVLCLAVRIMEAAVSSWSVVFGLGFDFDLHWPHIQFNMQIHAFKVLTLILWCFDGVDAVVGILCALQNKRHREEDEATAEKEKEADNLTLCSA